MFVPSQGLHNSILPRERRNFSLNIRMLVITTNKHFSSNFSFTTNKHLEGKLGVTNLSVIGDSWEIIKNPGWTL